MTEDELRTLFHEIDELCGGVYETSSRIHDNARIMDDYFFEEGEIDLDLELAQIKKDIMVLQKAINDLETKTKGYVQMNPKVFSIKYLLENEMDE